MRTLPFSHDSAAEAISILRSGGIIAHATETCYGFACDLSNEKAVAKLFAIKNRPVTQPISALFASIDDAKKYVEWNERAEELARKYLPGPLTLILPMRTEAPKKLFPIQTSKLENQQTSNHSLGIRISSSPVAESLVTAFHSPISTTSANLHGQPNPYSAEDIIAQFKDQTYQPDLILDSGMLPQTPPSTVINLAKDEGEFETLRQGLVRF